MIFSLFVCVQMNLGDGPKFVAIEVDLSATNKLKSILVSKFHLNNDFFKQGGRDPSQHYIIFRLGTGDDIYPQQVANINEVTESADNSNIHVIVIILEMVYTTWVMLHKGWMLSRGRSLSGNIRPRAT